MPMGFWYQLIDTAPELIFDLAILVLTAVLWQKLRPRSVFVLLGMLLQLGAVLFAMSTYFLAYQGARSMMLNTAGWVGRLLAIASWVFLVLTVLDRSRHPAPPASAVPPGLPPMPGPPPAQQPGPMPGQMPGQMPQPPGPGPMTGQPPPPSGPPPAPGAPPAGGVAR